MSLPPVLQSLKLPVIGAPMFIAAGFDPLILPKAGPKKINFGAGLGAETKVWRDIWSAGQGVGRIDTVIPVAEVVAQRAREYAAARQRLLLAS